MPTVVLTDSAILNRRIAYRCCAAMFDAKALRCSDLGDDTCAALYRARATQMMLAHKVMMGTPTSTEVNGSIVVSGAGSPGIDGIYLPTEGEGLDMVRVLVGDPNTYIEYEGNLWHIMHNDSPYYYQTSVEVVADPSAVATWGANFGVSPAPTFELVCSHKCYTHEQACEVMEKFDPFCIVCGCAPGEAEPTPVDCTITANFTVDEVIDSADVAATEAANQTDGYAYYIVSIVGGSGASPGQIGTYSTLLGGWQYNNPVPGSIILDSSTGINWVDYAFPDVPAPMFPPINSTSDGAGEYVIQSAFPWQSVGLSGNVVVEMFDGGLAWATVYTGTAASLATSVVLTLAEPGYNQIRVTYVVGACTYQYFNGVITEISNPPSSGRSLQGPIYTEVVTNVPGQPAGQFFNAMTQGWSYSCRAQFENTAFPDGTIPSVLFTMAGSTSIWVLNINADPMSGVITISAVISLVGQISLQATVPSWAGPTGDGNWHHIAVTRDPSALDDWSPAAVKLYFDGVNIPLTQTSTTPYVLGDVNELDEYHAFILSPIEANSRCWIDEMYACDHVCTPLEVMNVLKANTMSANDGSWGRQFWYRVESGDTDTEVANVITPAKLPLGVLGGNGVISTNVDPSI